jgi:hypothetical protein
MCDWSCGSLDNTPSDDVIPSLAQFHLFGRSPGPLGFRSGRLVCGGALSGTLGRLFCKSPPLLFTLDTASVVRRVVSVAATALRLLSRRCAPTGEVGATIPDAPVRVPAVTLPVSEALAALTLQWAFWRYVRLHRHSQLAK